LKHDWAITAISMMMMMILGDDFHDSDTTVPHCVEAINYNASDGTTTFNRHSPEAKAIYEPRFPICLDN